MDIITNTNSKYTFYIDVSGSVGNFSDYWKHGNQIYNKYKQTNQTHFIVSNIMVWERKVY